MKVNQIITWRRALLASLALTFSAQATLTNIVCNPADYTCQPSGVNNPVASATDAIGFAGAPGSSWCAILMFPLPTLPAGKQIGPQTTMAVTLNSIGASTTINADVWGVANFRTTLPGATPDSTYSYYLANNTGPGNNSTLTDVKLVDNFLTPALINRPGTIVMTPTGTTNNLQNYIQSFYNNNPTYDASVAQAYVWLRLNPDSVTTATVNRYVINAGDTSVTSTIRPVLNLDVVDVPTNSFVWNGDVSAVWDINTTPNWKSNGVSSLPYQDGAGAIFDDSLANNAAVTLNTTVSPSSVLINASTNYSISGSGKISGTASLIKTGSGTAILDTDNDYSGGTFLTGGTLQVGNGDTHGSIGSGPVTNNGVGSILAFNRTDAITVNTVVTRSYQYNATVVVNSGTVTLAGAGDNSATLAYVNGGTLILGKASGSTAHTLGSSSGINPGGTMQLGGSGGDQIFQTAYLTNNGTFDLAGLSEGINGLFGNGVVTNTVAAPSTLALGDGNGTATFAGVITDGAGTVALVKNGTGTQTLTGTSNTYSGGTIINAGKLAVPTGASGGNFTVANTATLGVNVVSSNGTYGVSTLTLNTSKMDLSILNSTTVAPVTITNLTVNGTVTINISSTNTFFPSQSYPLIAYANLTGSASSFILGTLPTGVSGTLDTSGNMVTFVVASVPVTWNGNVSDVWDINNTPNWRFGALTGLTYPDGDAVTFDDTLAGSTNILLNQTVSPLSVTFSNNTHGYILTGSGYITGTAKFTKAGTNTVIVDTDNDYIGGTVLLGGTLQIGNGDTHGTIGFGAFTNLTGGAILAFNRIDSISIGTITRTTVDNSARLVVNSGTVSLGGTGDNSGAIGIVNDGGTMILAKDSTASVHALSSFQPFLQINSGGLMQLGGFGDDQIYQSSGLTDKGVFDMAGHNEGFDMLNGSGLVTSSGGSSRLELGENNGSSTFTGALVDGSGQISFSKVGSGTISLLGTNNYTGDSAISAGELITSTASTGGGAYTLSDSAVLGVSVASPNGTLVTSSLTLGTSGSTVLELQNLNSPTTAVINAASVALNSAVTINITSGAFAAGHSYPLIAYSSISGTGGFTLGSMPSGLTATLNTNASPITLVVSSVINPTPPTLTTALSGNTLTLQWPSDRTGWLLQSNSIDLSNSNDWFTVPGSASTNKLDLQVDPAVNQSFFRLHF